MEFRFRGTNVQSYFFLLQYFISEIEYLMNFVLMTKYFITIDIVYFVFSLLMVGFCKDLVDIGFGRRNEGFFFYTNF